MCRCRRVEVSEKEKNGGRVRWRVCGGKRERKGQVNQTSKHRRECQEKA